MFTSRLLAAAGLLIALNVNGYEAETVVDCPVQDAKNNVFDASALQKKSIISIEGGNAEYPQILSLFRPVAGGCVKSEFARYPIEGGAPTVESVFFMPLRGPINVFAIVAWDINNRGEGTYGRFYQVYAYYYDGGGKLVENDYVSEDDAMTGIEGFSGGEESKFRYKTAADVKKYWRNKSKRASQRR